MILGAKIVTHANNMNIAVHSTLGTSTGGLRLLKNILYKFIEIVYSFLLLNKQYYLFGCQNYQLRRNYG
jgi:hypothetical protein